MNTSRVCTLPLQAPSWFIFAVIYNTSASGHAFSWGKTTPPSTFHCKTHMFLTLFRKRTKIRQMCIAKTRLAYSLAPNAYSTRSQNREWSMNSSLATIRREWCCAIVSYVLFRFVFFVCLYIYIYICFTLTLIAKLQDYSHNINYSQRIK